MTYPWLLHNHWDNLYLHAWMEVSIFSVQWPTESEDELISGWPGLASGAWTQLQILCYNVTSSCYKPQAWREIISHVLGASHWQIVKYLAFIYNNNGKINPSKTSNSFLNDKTFIEIMGNWEFRVISQEIKTISRILRSNIIF